MLISYLFDTILHFIANKKKYMRYDWLNRTQHWPFYNLGFKYLTLSGKCSSELKGYYKKYRILQEKSFKQNRLYVIKAMLVTQQ